MTLLDTNVISELMRPKPDPVVLAWFDAQDGRPLYISTVTEGELWSGLERLPEGRRREALRTAIEETLSGDFAGRTLGFDRAAARRYGRISAERARLGRPIGTADCQIAAIAHAHGLRVATRNIQDFENCDVALVNPWTMT